MPIEAPGRGPRWPLFVAALVGAAVALWQVGALAPEPDAAADHAGVGGSPPRDVAPPRGSATVAVDDTVDDTYDAQFPATSDAAPATLAGLAVDPDPDVRDEAAALQAALDAELADAAGP